MGQMVRLARMKMGLKGAEFGDLLGVSSQMVSRIELGAADLRRDHVLALLRTEEAIGRALLTILVMEKMRRAGVAKFSGQLEVSTADLFDEDDAEELVGEAPDSSAPDIDVPSEVVITEDDWTDYTELLYARLALRAINKSPAGILAAGAVARGSLMNPVVGAAAFTVMRAGKVWAERQKKRAQEAEGSGEFRWQDLLDQK